MATLKQARSLTVWDWIAYRLSQIVASSKPQLSAADVQAAVARSGNPAGA